MEPLEHLDHARLAVAVLVARERGDTTTATEVLASFPDAAAMASGFVTVAELAMQVGASHGGPEPAAILREIGHGLAVSDTVRRSDGR